MMAVVRTQGNDGAADPIFITYNQWFRPSVSRYGPEPYHFDANVGFPNQPPLVNGLPRHLTFHPQPPPLPRNEYAIMWNEMGRRHYTNFKENNANFRELVLKPWVEEIVLQFSGHAGAGQIGRRGMCPFK